MKSTSKFPAAVYRDTVLTHIFADAKRLFLDSMLEIDYAHLVMLAEQRIVPRDVAVTCLRGLDALDVDAISRAEFDGSFEDLFFLLERRLAELCGVENAGRIHTARSRNDIDMTMYRMVLRARLMDAMEAALLLRGCLVKLADEHRESLIPAYTHNQPAQPTTLGHYLMAMVEILERDTERLQAAFARVNRSPLGACAIATTGFPINRERTAHLLGFDGLQVNSYGAIAAVDYVTESCSVLSVMMLGLGRFGQDLLLWSTAEFGYLRLSDGYVQISSIMPQKRNPVPLEHVRILSSRAYSQSQAVLNSLHNTPFADMNDSEDPLQPLVDLAFGDGIRALQLLAGILSEASFDKAKMESRAQGYFLTVTELADTIVRSTGLSFHEAHGIVSRAVKELAGNFDRRAMVDIVRNDLANLTGREPEMDLLYRALDAKNFVQVRNVIGGPAPDALGPEISRAQAQIKTDLASLTSKRQRLRDAADELRAAVDQLSGAEP